MLPKPLDNGGFRGRPELMPHGGDIVEVSMRFRVASGSSLMAVMVVRVIVLSGSRKKFSGCVLVVDFLCARMMERKVHSHGWGQMA